MEKVRNWLLANLRIITADDNTFSKIITLNVKGYAYMRLYSSQSFLSNYSNSEILEKIYIEVPDINSTMYSLPLTLTALQTDVSKHSWCFVPVLSVLEVPFAPNP